MKRVIVAMIVTVVCAALGVVASWGWYSLWNDMPGHAGGLSSQEQEAAENKQMHEMDALGIKVGSITGAFGLLAYLAVSVALKRKRHA